MEKVFTKEWQEHRSGKELYIEEQERNASIIEEKTMQDLESIKGYYTEHSFTCQFCGKEIPFAIAKDAKDFDYILREQIKKHDSLCTKTRPIQEKLESIKENK